MQSASEKLKARFNNDFHICVGLDTDINKIPKYFLKYSDPVFEFNKIVIENTCETAAAFKINFAFYEREGAKGIENLAKTLEIIPKNLFTIADAKRGDIGNTSQMYAASVYEHFNFDSVTLHPYMGYDSISPFLEYSNKLSFILALTSNQGSADFEKLRLADGRFLFQEVIEKVKTWNTRNNCGVVFGATNLSELQENIQIFGNLPVLLPGVGAQGGNLKEIVKVFQNQAKSDYLINVSRALLYCDDSERFPAALKTMLADYNETIRKIKE
jgi:orotidine-5'-phosphate decarboxylase